MPKTKTPETVDTYGGDNNMDTKKILCYVVLGGIFAALVFWFYFTAKWIEHQEDIEDKNAITQDEHFKERHISSKIAISFNALVATGLLYFILKSY